MDLGRAHWALWGLVLFTGGTAHAQYRGNGFLVEAGAETFEVVPLTLAAAAGSELLRRGWQEAETRHQVGAMPSWMQSCAYRLSHGMDGPPCRNNWYQMMDAPYVMVGFQHVLGDLLVDISETPLIRNIVLSGRSGLAASFTTPLMGVFRPVGMMHNEVGIRWNMADERWRPFIGINAGVNVYLDPVGSILRTMNMGETCRKFDAGEKLSPDETCVREGGVAIPGTGGTRVTPEMGLFAANLVPVLFSIRPEAGLEYFFTEDISVQFHASVAAVASPIPSFLLRPPFVNATTRVGSSLVAYF